MAVVAVLVGLIGGVLIQPVAGVLLGIVLAALAGGAVVLGTRSRPAVGSGERATPRLGGDAASWLSRAQKTVAEIHRERASVDGTLTDRLGSVTDEADAVLEVMHRLAAQVTSVEDALYRIDVPTLETRIRDGGPSADTAGIQGQLDVAGRLRDSRSALLERMQRSAVGLDGVLARMVEVLALADDRSALGEDGADRRIVDMSDELDGLRAGLVETESVSRRVLGTG